MHYPKSIEVFDSLARRGDASAFDHLDPGVVFTTGGCALYATGLVKAHGWAVVSVGLSDCAEWDEDPDLRPCGDYLHGICGCKTHHFYALSPDGWVYDVHGEHDPVALQDDHAIWSIPDESLRLVLEDWHLWSEDGADMAALARRLTRPLRAV